MDKPLLFPFESFKQLPSNYTILEETDHSFIFSMSFEKKEELYEAFLLADFQIERFDYYFRENMPLHFQVACNKKSEELVLLDVDILYKRDHESFTLRRAQPDHHFYSFLLESVHFQMIHDAGLSVSDFYTSRFNWKEYYDEVVHFPFEKKIAQFSLNKTRFVKQPFIEICFLHPGKYTGTVLLDYELSDTKTISIHLRYKNGVMKYDTYAVGLPISVIEEFDTLSDAYDCLKKSINKIRLRLLFEEKANQ